LGDDTWAIVEGHLNVEMSPVVFEGGGHLNISCPVLEVVYLNLVGLYTGGELGDVAAGFGEALVGGSCSLSDSGDKAVGNGVCGVMEVAIVVHTEDCLC